MTTAINPEMMLMMQYLSNAGSAISQGQPMAPALNQVTNQAITNQSLIKLLQTMLGGGEGSLPAGAKITADRDNFSMKLPTGSLGGWGGEGGGFGADKTLAQNRQIPQAQVPQAQVPQAQIPQGGTASTPHDSLSLKGMGPWQLNPSSSPLGALSVADLAGLTPKDIFQAMQFKFAQDEMVQKRRTDAVDATYKEALTLQALESIGTSRTNAQTSRLKALTELQKTLRSAPLTVPGLGGVTLDEWNALDTKTKAYSYYAYDAQLRKEQVMPYNEWSQQTNEPTAKQLYDLAVEDPAFGEWLTKYQESGATRITMGEKVETRRAFADVDAETYFTDPKGMIKDVQAWINDTTQRVQWAIEDTEQGQQRKKAEMSAQFIRGKINSAGGKVRDIKVDGRTMIWTVEWPDGNVREVKYDF